MYPMTKHDIDELLNHSEIPCVSIIVPTHRLSPDRIKDRVAVEKAVLNAKELLFKSYSKDISGLDSVMEKLDEMVNKIDFLHTKDGIGIFVSPSLSKLIVFPFEVAEKVKVDAIFDSRDLLYYSNSIIDYAVFSISKKYLKIFNGKGDELIEIKSGDFPMVYEEEYEYATPSRGNSFGNTLKAFEKDKSILQEIRLVDFLRSADELLDKYIDRNLPIVVAGGKKEIADYLSVSAHKHQIIATVVGNYGFNGDGQLANLAWNQVQNYLKNQHETLLSNLHELLGKELISIGIKEVWEAAKEGKGLELIVEKDFECPVYIGNNDSDLKLKKPLDEKEYKTVSDSVEKSIRKVISKGGKVIFVDNGYLMDFSGIALRLRYNTRPH
jgi:hypothetical protein